MKEQVAIDKYYTFDFLYSKQRQTAGQPYLLLNEIFYYNLFLFPNGSYLIWFAHKP